MSTRSRRSSYKPLFVDHNLLKKIKKITETNGKKFIKTHSRRSSIIPAMVGFTIAVHNGKKYVDVYISPEMVMMSSFKLGDFVPTRIFKGHPKETTKAAPAKKGKK